jgi:nucleoside diphosphate kinase
VISADPAKLERYARDIAFREAWTDLAACWGDEAEDILSKRAFVLFKPEAVLARYLEEATGELERHGFAPVLWRLVRLDRNLVRGIWRYELAEARLATLAAVDIVATAGVCLLVGLRDDRPEPGRYAAARLASLKGPARQAERRPGQIRYRLRNPALLLNFLHTPDEPADAVRELGVLFAADERLALFDELRAGRDVSLGPAFAAAYAETPPHALDLDASLELLAREHDAPEADTISSLLRGAAAEPGEELVVRLIRWLDTQAVRLPRPDRAVLAAHLLVLLPRPEGPAAATYTPGPRLRPRS